MKIKKLTKTVRMIYLEIQKKKLVILKLEGNWNLELKKIFLKMMEKGKLQFHGSRKFKSLTNTFL